jgi:PEP-CTERM motif
MRGIPMIFALTIGGVCYADAMGWIDGPMSLMHPKSRPSITKVEIDLSDAPRAPPDLPPAIIDKDIEWIADVKKAALITEDGGDGEEKRMFWHTVWTDDPAAPFPGWVDPNPLIYPVVTVTQAPGTAGLQFAGNPVIEDRHGDIVSAPVLPPQPVFGPLGGTIGGQSDKKVLQSFVFNMDDVFPKQVTDPVLIVLCSADPSMPPCVTGDPPGDPGDPVIKPVQPGDPIIAPPPPVVVTGPIGGGGGIGGGPAGAVPEPSTYAMLVLGFAGLALTSFWRGRMRPPNAPRVGRGGAPGAARSRLCGLLRT